MGNRDDHSASRRIDVLREEAPHLLADPDDVRRRITASAGDVIVVDGIRHLLVPRLFGYALVREDQL